MVLTHNRYPRWLVLVLAVSLSALVLVLASSAQASGSSDSPFAGGSGTEDDPYRIANVEQLQAVKDYLNSHFILINDIDASDTVNWNDGKGFEPIGNSLNEFKGTFDGQGHEIRNLYIDRPDEYYVGLFGYVSGVVKISSVVKNIGVVDVDVTGEKYVGGLVGCGSVSDSYSTGSVTGDQRVGGLVGARGGVSDSYSTCSVTGSGIVGGLVGGNWRTVSGSYSTGAVTRSGPARAGYTDMDSAGGLVGRNGGTVSESYSTGSVTGSGIVGGLVGYNEGVVSNSYSTGSATADGSAGGLVGTNDGPVSESYSTGSVTGSGFVGGLIGYKWVNNPSASKSFWDTQTSGQSLSAGGSGKTTRQMKTKETFTNAGWDFENTWGIDGITNDGYPFLLAFTSPLETWELTTSVNPSGAGSISPSSGFYVNGEEVTLTASADSGYEFSHWSGGASGTSTQITITMDGDKHVVANFVEEEPEEGPSEAPEQSGQEGPSGGFPWLVILLTIFAILLIAGLAVYLKRKKSKPENQRGESS